MKRPNLRFLIPCANERRKRQLLHILEGFRDLDITLTDGRSSEVMAASDAILIASGTASLEAALHKRPMVISYRMAPLSFAIISRLVKVKHVGLPNLLAKEPLVPELLQEEATPDKLAAAMMKALQDDEWRALLRKEFTEIHHALKQDASVLAWEAIESVLGKYDAAK